MSIKRSRGFNEARIDGLMYDVAAMKKDIKWLVNALSNFHPFNGDLPEGLDPTFYQTLSYDGDLELLEKFMEIKSNNNLLEIEGLPEDD